MGAFPILLDVPLFELAARIVGGATLLSKVTWRNKKIRRETWSFCLLGSLCVEHSACELFNWNS